MKVISNILLFLISIGCSSNVTGPEEKGELPRNLSATEKQLVEADNSFSFQIFRQMPEADKNVFISPLSISLALGMTLNGANGETYNEMQETLELNGLDLEEINKGYKSLINLLKNADPKVKMEIANSVWSKDGFEMNEDFTERLNEYFSAEARSLDFNDPKSVDVINNWVENNTNGLIEKIIETIPPHMVMYLINAIYFKGDWLYEFEKEQTAEETFYLENEEEISVPLMNQKTDLAGYFSDDVQMIDLPYGDSLFSMTVMMPTDKNTSLDSFIEEKVNHQNFTNWIGKLSVSETLIKLPKFEMSYEKMLNDILIDLGMPTAFSGEADFSGINPSEQLFISEVRHKSFITVDEKGTEAAAVTSVGIGVTSAPSYKSMIVNRPFVFVIREQNSGAILFMGKVNDPLD